AVFPAPGVYEAEEATIDHVALEEKYSGFSGFGYVAAFAKDKQGVGFDVEVPQAGQYSLEWRYAAGAGAASRPVLVNGPVVAAAEAFAATTDWMTWASVKSAIMLPQGKSLIELRFDAAKGGAGALNLDRLTLSDH